MTEKERADDGLGFDNVPEIYDRVRPTYPPELFDELFSYLRPGGDGELRAVEIGPATGQATRPLLEHGMAVTAVEPGEALAEFLRTKLGGEFPQLDVTTAKFEGAELESGAFDLVLAATSFHWLDPCCAAAGRSLSYTRTRSRRRRTKAFSLAYSLSTIATSRTTRLSRSRPKTSLRRQSTTA